jgi:hypothetical protein
MVAQRSRGNNRASVAISGKVSRTRYQAAQYGELMLEHGDLDVLLV